MNKEFVSDLILLNKFLALPLIKRDTEEAEVQEEFLT